MNKPHIQRKKILASLIGAVFGAVLMPSGALASEADLMRRIDALQQELQALKAQVNAAPAASGGGGGSGGVSAPAGFEMSIYGRGHVSGDRIDIDRPLPGVSSSDSYFHSNSSRLGFKGSQALPGGMSAFFQFESGVDLTGNGAGDGNGGPGNTFNGLFTRARDSFVGLKGNWGSVAFGRQGAFNQWVYDYNLFGDQVGDLGNIWGLDHNVAGRQNRMMKYTTPNFRGFTLALSYAPDQGATNNDVVIAKADYGNGGLKVSGAYAKVGTGAASPDSKISAIIASYETSVFTVGGGWQRETDKTIGAARGNQTKYTLGGGINVGNGMVKLQYARANDNSVAANTGANQVALGYDYNWRNDTTLYVAYARTSNDANASYVAYDYGHGSQGVPAFLAGATPKALSIGLVYKFDVGLFGKR